MEIGGSFHQTPMRSPAAPPFRFQDSTQQEEPEGVGTRQHFNPIRLDPIYAQWYEHVIQTCVFQDDVRQNDSQYEYRDARPSPHPILRHLSLNRHTVLHANQQKPVACSSVVSAFVACASFRASFPSFVWVSMAPVRGIRQPASLHRPLGALEKGLLETKLRTKYACRRTLPRQRLADS